VLEPAEPLELLERWLEEAEAAGEAAPWSVAFVTVGEENRPTARTVRLKRVEKGGLLFSSALWTRKVRELAANPHVSLLFHWPTIGRQVHIAGRAAVADRKLAQELFDERDLPNRMQALVSRQGQPIDSLEPLRIRHAHLMQTMEAPPLCPEDWGALRVVPDALEFWREAQDRMHDRLLYERVSGGWRVTRLAP
jgi:pyridoxamine 5'-phosphate oxidase